MEYRCILSDVVLWASGEASAIVVSEDSLGEEEGRNPLYQGQRMKTSAVVNTDVVEGQLVMTTVNSKYLIEGPVLTEAGHYLMLSAAVAADLEGYLALHEELNAELEAEASEVPDE